MPPTSTRTNHVARCDAVRCDGSSCQFLIAMKMLAPRRARNKATSRYFHGPRASWSPVLPMTKFQKSETGFDKESLPECGLARDAYAESYRDRTALTTISRTFNASVVPSASPFSKSRSACPIVLVTWARHSTDAERARAKV